MKGCSRIFETHFNHYQRKEEQLNSDEKFPSEVHKNRNRHYNHVAKTDDRGKETKNSGR
jgi:hypothetical protein